jgi:signal transduction histidine kinase
VRDHGIGIAPDDHGRIFERFERAVSRRATTAGSGWACTPRARSSKSHGETIGVESTPGDGALFGVTLSRV